METPNSVVFECKITLCFNDGIEDPYTLWIKNDNAEKFHLRGIARKTLNEAIGIFIRDFPSIISEELKLQKLPENFPLQGEEIAAP